MTPRKPAAGKGRKLFNRPDALLVEEAALPLGAALPPIELHTGGDAGEEDALEAGDDEMLEAGEAEEGLDEDDGGGPGLRFQAAAETRPVRIDADAMRAHTARRAVEDEVVAPVDLVETMGEGVRVVDLSEGVEPSEEAEAGAEWEDEEEARRGSNGTVEPPGASVRLAALPAAAPGGPLLAAHTLPPGSRPTARGLEAAELAGVVDENAPTQRQTTAPTLVMDAIQANRVTERVERPAAPPPRQTAVGVPPETARGLGSAPPPPVASPPVAVAPPAPPPPVAVASPPVAVAPPPVAVAPPAPPPPVAVAPPPVAPPVPPVAAPPPTHAVRPGPAVGPVPVVIPAEPPPRMGPLPEATRPVRPGGGAVPLRDVRAAERGQAPPSGLSPLLFGVGGLGLGVLVAGAWFWWSNQGGPATPVADAAAPRLDVGATAPGAPGTPGTPGDPAAPTGTAGTPPVDAAAKTPPEAAATPAATPATPPAPAPTPPKSTPSPASTLASSTPATPTRVTPTTTASPEDTTPKGLIQIKSDVDCLVIVDGKQRGYTPALGPIELTAGTHIVRGVVPGKGYSRTVEVRVDAGVLRQVELRFNP